MQKCGIYLCDNDYIVGDFNKEAQATIEIIKKHSIKENNLLVDLPNDKNTITFVLCTGQKTYGYLFIFLENEDSILGHLKATLINFINIVSVDLERRCQRAELEEYKNHLEEMVQKRADEIFELEEEKIENFERTFLSFVSIIEDRDTYTGGHSQRVAKYCRIIAQDMKCSEEECDLIYRAGILHDIGKIITPDAILLKSNKLNDLEYKIIKQHVSEGYKILLKIPMYKNLAEIIRYHHERYDGKGYPNGIKKDDIPFLSRIMTLADAFDAMTTNRIYKKKKSIKEVISELKEFSGTQFDPKVVKSALRVLVDIELQDSVNQSPTTDIEKERFSYSYRDQLTNAYNVDYLNFILTQNKLSQEYVSVILFKLNNFTQYNKRYGWDKGDKLLIQVVDCLDESFVKSLIFRVYGDDFIIILKEHTKINLKQLRCYDMLIKNQISISEDYLDLLKFDITDLKSLEQQILENSTP
ncbi:MAG: HD domain-containing protein [Sulfurimonas sp.]|nr:HD domain-containing protein [Sulfurimonas sp.]